MNPRLHTVAQAAAVVGAIGAVALTLYAGRDNGLPVLMILMAGWVFAPFFGFALASRFTSQWPARARVMLDVTIVVIAILSLAIYARNALGPEHAQRATPYVAVPIVSWLLLSAVMATGAVLARRRSGSVGA